MIYEIMTVYPSRFIEGEVEGLTNAFKASVEALGGKVESSQNLGKIKLAYPIKRDRHGHYVLSYVDLGPELMTKLDQTLRLSDDVLRHMVIACPKGIPTDSYKLIPYQQPLTPEGRRTGEREASRGRGEKEVAASEASEVKA